VEPEEIAFPLLLLRIERATKRSPPASDRRLVLAEDGQGREQLRFLKNAAFLLDASRPEIHVLSEEEKGGQSPRFVLKAKGPRAER